jgi:hypothetical protein
MIIFFSASIWIFLIGQTYKKLLSAIFIKKVTNHRQQAGREIVNKKRSKKGGLF